VLFRRLVPPDPMSRRRCLVAAAGPLVPNGRRWRKERSEDRPVRPHRVLRFSSELSRLPVRIHEGDDLFEPRDYITGLQELLLFIDPR